MTEFPNRLSRMPTKVGSAWTLKYNVRSAMFLAVGWVVMYLAIQWLTFNDNYDSRLVRNIARSVAAFVPSIDKFAASAAIPGVIEAFMSLVWLATAATILVVAVRGVFPFDHRTSLPWKNRWVMLCVIVLCFVVAPIAVLFFGRSEVTASKTVMTDFMVAIQWNALTSKVWLALWGLITYTMMALAATVSIGLCRNFNRLWLHASTPRS
jgi:hypothetical protein